MPGIIDTVEPDSIAEELDWQVGDQIVSINGHALSDLIDYQFYSADEHLVVIVRRGDETAEFEIEKDIDDDLGVAFEDALFDGVRTCGAKCIFCFVDQLPKGLRKSLYLKDDDYRLSFLHSNFVTLANVSDDDLQRIATQRLSPVYVSVHTTNPALREKMLGREAPSILDQIDALSHGNIALHTQIVLCQGINDDDELDRTVEDLAARYPTVRSIAIVPAGVTAHRRHKTPIGSIDAQYSAAILDKVRQWQRRFCAEKGTRLVWAADEFYLNSGQRVPKASVYEGFPQIGNGVGLVRKFTDSAYRAKRLVAVLQEKLRRPLGISVVTGQLAAPVLSRWADSVKCDNLTIKVYPISNHLFGDTVTVTGLMAGKDVVDQLQGKDLGDLVAVPSVALRDGAFLDDVTLADVEEALGTPVASVAPTPEALLRLVLQFAASQCGSV
jgi:putative radical SAM enzyme (TIGR03279 family)